MQFVVVLLIAFLLSGCTSDPTSHEALSKEVEEAVSDGMLLKDAFSELEASGFACREGTTIDPQRAGSYECTRERSGLVYGCVHRVVFDAPTPDAAINNVQVYPPACAGM